MFPDELSLIIEVEAIPARAIRRELKQAIPTIRDLALNLRYRNPFMNDKLATKLDELLGDADQALKSLEKLESVKKPLFENMLTSQIVVTQLFISSLSRFKPIRLALEVTSLFGLSSNSPVQSMQGVVGVEMYRNSILTTELCIQELLFHGEDSGHWLQKLERSFESALEDVAREGLGELLDDRDANVLLAVWNSVGGDHPAIRGIIKTANITSESHIAFRTPPRLTPPFEILYEYLSVIDELKDSVAGLKHAHGLGSSFFKLAFALALEDKRAKINPYRGGRMPRLVTPNTRWEGFPEPFLKLLDGKAAVTLAETLLEGEEGKKLIKAVADAIDLRSILWNSEKMTT
ncbi:hypothetical protein BOTBODRAFT_184582 [Botryobasidium botryosum FD-172 SS1]|uniref:Uncharacterized protein n=1 Tax=Botryobasidium botryosum (strain FD-172 SS1) TaxID=930990 RepID=A0A067MV39_BOTB1|nr:hypothetical protein BOTBODRAFT_184582 [Botryobasidium botryosum FD-172 SS1]